MPALTCICHPDHHRLLHFLCHGVVVGGDAFLLELTGAREIVLVKIGTDFNAADLFTKVLAVEKFDTFTAYVLGER